VAFSGVDSSVLASLRFLRFLVLPSLGSFSLVVLDPSGGLLLGRMVGPVLLGDLLFFSS